MAKRSGSFLCALLASLLTLIGCGSRVAPSSGVSTTNAHGSTTGSSITVAPMALDFSEVTVGSRSALQNIEISNPGPNAVGITVATDSSEFSVSNTCGNLQGGGTCGIGIRFTPTQAGIRTAKLMLTVAPGNSTTPVPLSGTGASNCCGHHDGTGIPIPVNAWTTFQSAGFPAEIVGYDATAYASSIKRHIVLGKYHHYSSEPNYCMDGWSWDENRWDILDCSDAFHNEHSMEAGHTTGSFVYMNKRDSIVYWGGQSGSNQMEQAYQTWWWDVTGHTGRNKLTFNRPGNIRVSAMTYDEAHDKAVLFPDAAFNTEIYDPVTNSWSTPAVSGTPPPNGLTFPTMDWDSADGRSYLYGGAAGNNCTTGLAFNNDVYAFDLSTNTWTKLVVAPDPVYGSPPGRWYAGFAYNPDDNTFLVAGGQYCSSGNAVGLTDTWKLDPIALKWTKIIPQSNYVLRVTSAAPFQKLRYDPDHHAFVMVLASYDNSSSTGGTWGNYPARVWVYCPTGSCPNVGTQTVSYPVPAGSINTTGGQTVTATNQSWAQDTTVATNGSSIYAGWVESGRPFYSGMCDFHHPYVRFTSDGMHWSNLGKDCSALDSAAATGLERDAFQPNLAVVNGTLWASWSATDTGHTPVGVFAKYWDGTSWVGGRIGARISSSQNTQSFSQMTAVGQTPTLAFIEENRTVFPQILVAFVDQFNGSSWSPLGGPLNVDPTQGRVEFLSITSDGATPWACWTENKLQVSSTNTGPGWGYVIPTQLYCAKWSGSNWVTSSSLNHDPNSWASEVSTTFLNGKLYLAWTERTTAGNTNVYVQVYDVNTGTWHSAGNGAVNNDSTAGWSFHPRLANDATNVYLSWEEQWNPSSPGISSLGQPSRLYVSKWNGSAWSALGPELNVDPINGTAKHSSLAISAGSPVAVWNEIQLGQLQQTFMKKWNGTSWELLTKQ